MIKQNKIQEKFILKAEKREITGKALVDYRKEGKLPGVVYGPKIENTLFFVEAGEFLRLWNKAGESTLVDLEIEGKKVSALIQSVDLDPVLNEPIHVDFYAPDLTKKITTAVPLVFEGEAPAVKIGGTLVKVMHELEIEAMAKDLPSEIIIDISRLETFEDKIIVADIKLPEGVEVTTEDKEGVVALVEEVKEEAEEEVPSAADVETVDQKGKEEVLVEEESSEE